MIQHLTDADRQKVAAAIAAAEANSNGEIVAVATPISDPYHDVGLHWALIPLFAVLAWAAWRPSALIWWYNFLFGGWQPAPTLSQLLTLLMVFAALKFTVAARADSCSNQASPRSAARGSHLQVCGGAPHDGSHGHPHLFVDG